MQVVSPVRSRFLAFKVLLIYPVSFQTTYARSSPLRHDAYLILVFSQVAICNATSRSSPVGSVGGKICLKYDNFPLRDAGDVSGEPSGLVDHGKSAREVRHQVKVGER